MEAHVRHENVQIRVPIIIAQGESHPGAGQVNAHRGANGRESDHARRRVIAEHLEAIAIVGYPQVCVTIIVMVEEKRRPRLSRRVANDVACGIDER